MSASILVIDDERGIRALCQDTLKRAGFDVEVADCAAAGLAAVGRRRFDLAFCDINLPDQDGISLLPKLLHGEGAPTVILITAFPSVDTAVKGMKLGARDYLAKPFGPDELRMVARRALEEDALRRQNRALRDRLAYGDLIGTSPSMVELRRTVDKVAGSGATVLVTGESGTGKELVARALHFAGERANAPFVPVNCGALVESLLESELFGHVRGAFTGADRDRRGLFEVADGGTLFLDEVADTTPAMQAKLLRVVQDGHVRRVGDERTRKVDVRLVVASQRPLAELVAAGRFRDDLRFRLEVIQVTVPPLRARLEDVPLLVEHFLDRIASKLAGGKRPELTRAALRALGHHAWPGNVRELENAIARACALGDDVIDVEDLPETVARSRLSPAAASGPGADLALRPALDLVERAYLEAAMSRTNNNQTAAARLLGLSRFGLQKKLRRLAEE